MINEKKFFTVVCTSVLCMMLGACSNTKQSSEQPESSTTIVTTEESTEQTTENVAYEIEKVEIANEDIVAEGNIWTVGKATSMNFIVNGDYSKFKRIEIDGIHMYSNGYTIESDGTVISIPANYLDNYASVGEHTLSVKYEDGEATVTFNVEFEKLPPLEGFYEYPLTSEDEEWKEISVAKRVKACRIPQNVLESMNDEQLIQATLDYPFLIDTHSYSSLEEGAKQVAKICDAFAELLRRESGKDSCIAFIEENYVLNASELPIEEIVKRDEFLVLVKYHEEMKEKLTEEDMEIITKASENE